MKHMIYSPLDSSSFIQISLRSFLLLFRSISMRTKVEEFFLYYERWVTQSELYLQSLLVGTSGRPQPSEAKLRDLVTTLTAHHKEYYTQKWAAAQEDVLAFFSPAWATPLENAYLWLTGWKPSTAFRLVSNLRKAGTTTLGSLSEEQVERIEQLRVKIEYEEEKVDGEMERQQVGLADRRLEELARLASRLPRDDVEHGEGDGSTQVSGLVDAAVRSLMAGLERVMKAADCLRLKTIKGLLDLLSPSQCVEFLAGISMLHIRMRQWGQLRRQTMAEQRIVAQVRNVAKYVHVHSEKFEVV